MADRDEGVRTACGLALALGFGSNCAALDLAAIADAPSVESVRGPGDVSSGIPTYGHHDARDAPEFPGADPSLRWHARATVLTVIDCPTRADQQTFVWLRLENGEEWMAALGPRPLLDLSLLEVREGDAVELWGFEIPPELRTCRAAWDMKLLAATSIVVGGMEWTIRDGAGYLLRGGPSARPAGPARRPDSSPLR